MKRTFIFSFLCLLVPVMVWAASLPPPGATNPAVTQATISTTICVRGWTATIRPSVTYTNRLKRQQITARGYADTNPRHYEEDHYIPLEIGGHPTDPNNLWPQPWPEARKKDQVENTLHRAVCQGTLTLQQAQTTIRHWRP